MLKANGPRQIHHLPGGSPRAQPLGPPFGGEQEAAADRHLRHGWSHPRMGIRHPLAGPGAIGQPPDQRLQPMWPGRQGNLAGDNGPVGRIGIIGAHRDKLAVQTELESLIRRHLEGQRTFFRTGVKSKSEAQDRGFVRPHIGVPDPRRPIGRPAPSAIGIRRAPRPAAGYTEVAMLSRVRHGHTVQSSSANPHDGRRARPKNSADNPSPISSTELGSGTTATPSAINSERPTPAARGPLKFSL